jgi:universal stress protein E
MKALRDILVAIKEPASRSQPALRKAGQLAEGSGARLTLFHALTTPLAVDAFAIAGQTLQQAQKQFSEHALAQLEKLATPWQARGVAVNVATDWDFPAYEAVIRQARRQGADLVVAERHAKRHLLPSLLRFNDWELLRRCPVPVLLVKRGGDWQRPVVLAAIDPAHSFAKPTRLDAMIMSAAQLMADSLSGKLHIAHAWPGLPLPASMEELAITAPDTDRRARREARAAFDAEIDEAGVAEAKRHFAPGNPVELIPKLARRHRAGIVVMGAISRSGLQRLVVGNVAEQVLDSLACDVLVVKPAEFKTRVRPQRRGVQLIATPSYVT